jgi:hypothetical protein
VKVQSVELANETDICPPHYWKIDMTCLGTCSKCGSTKQFEGPVAQDWDFPKGDGRNHPKRGRGGTRKEAKDESYDN